MSRYKNMKRSIRININYANQNKLNQLDLIIIESMKVINLYIDQLWTSNKKNNKFVDFKVESWLSARISSAWENKHWRLLSHKERKRNKLNQL